MSRGAGPQMQMVVPFTPMVKLLVIINVAIWIGLQIILERFILGEPVVTYTLGLVPEKFVQSFYVWQPLTYMFLHSANVFHIVFNMLLLWWLGAELEGRWGSKFFMAYYLVSGLGAALIYIFGIVVFALITDRNPGWSVPVVGASGSIFGLMLAYGIIFGERVVYFMMLFPMKAKYFVMILGAVEIATLLNSGFGSDVANLAHLGGILSGFLFLTFYTRLQQGRWRKKSTGRGRGLRLVVNNDRKDKDDQSGPKYWN